MLKILSMPIGLDACSGYRIKKPLEGLALYTEADTYVVDLAKTEMQGLIKALREVDIIYLRPGAELSMDKIKGIPELKDIKAKWVMDIDDNTDIISPYSQFYKEYGLKEFKHGDKWIWKDGQNFSIEKNQKRVDSLKYGMIRADLVTVTTPKLAEHAREFNKNVYVNDNTIDFNHWYRLKNKANKRLRVVWQGSPSHYEDWYDIKSPLNKLMDEYDFELIMLGSAYPGVFKKEHQKRVTVKPWVSFEAHSYRMMSLQADIGIIPLADLPFNWYKSAIKWYENAAMGLPTVVSNILPYSDVIQNGKTALGYNKPDEFYKQMKKLLENKGVRANIANSAYDWVYKHKNLEVESQKLYKRLTKLVKEDNGSKG